MQLEFVYKNKIASGESILYEIVEGANISMSYNEDLSNGNIVIRENNEIDIEPYDEIIIHGLDYIDKLYMLIDSYTCTETRNRNNDKVYTYEIKIMSQTKLLENKILPSLAITPKTNGGLTIKQYLERYNDLYGQKIRTASGFANKFIFDVGTKFDDVCPELQFNNPTLRECITQLMMVKNCIPTVQNNVISYIDLSEKHDLLDKNDENIAYVETSQSSADYVSSIKTNIKNVIQEDGYVTTTEYIGFRSDSSVVNDKNLKLYTQYPIYEILSLKIYCPTQYTRGSGGDYGCFTYGDLVQKKLICEYSKWKTLEVVKELWPDAWADFPKYQNTVLYYTRGNNVIENFESSSFHRTWISWSESAISMIIRGIMAEHSTGSKSINDTNWKYCTFAITYKTKSDVVTNIGKSKLQTTEREVVDNQNDNYINAYTFGLLEYAKANRLGNKIKTYNGRFPRNYSELPVVGDYYEGNEIIYKIDYEVYQHCVDATIYTCPNYVLRNYFTSVQSKLRSWRIVDGNEAFYREDNIKYYLEFDYSEHQEKNNEIVLNTENFIKYCFGAINDTPLNVAIITAKTIGAIYPDDFVMDTFKNVCGNSIVFTFGYTDNYELYKYIDNADFEGGMKQKMYSYVDENGNFSQIRYSLLKSYVSLADVPQEFIGESYGKDARDAMRARMQPYSMQQPKKTLASYTYFLSIAQNIYKDNKEIPKINTQFEFCSADGVLLGDEFIKGHKGNGIPKSQLKIRISDVEPEINVLPSGTDIDISNAVITTSWEGSSTAKLTINNMPTDKYCYIYNTANNGILLAFKGNEIWLNLLKQRNKNIYNRDSNNNLIVVDHI